MTSKVKKIKLITQMRIKKLKLNENISQIYNSL